MKNKAIFLKKIGKTTYRKIGEKKFNLTEETISFKDHTFVLPRGENSYEDNKKSYVFFDFDNSEILSFVKTNMGIDSKFLDKLIVRNIVGKLIQQLRSSMEEPNKWKLMPFVFVFIFGLVVGFTLATNPALIGA